MIIGKSSWSQMEIMNIDDKVFESVYKKYQRLLHWCLCFGEGDPALTEKCESFKESKK